MSPQPQMSSPVTKSLESQSRGEALASKGKGLLCVCVCRLMLHHYVIVNWVLTIQNPETKYFFEETKYFLSLNYFNNFQRAAMVRNHTEHPLKTC